jgi:hypothetical protein
LIPQYRHELDGHGDREYDWEGQEQVLRPSFYGNWDSVRDLLGMRLDKLAWQFAATYDVKVKKEKVKKEIERLARDMASSKGRVGSCRREGLGPFQVRPAELTCERSRVERRHSLCSLKAKLFYSLW